MHSLHKNNNLGHVTFHGMEIVASVTSSVIVGTIPKVKVKDVQIVGKIKIYFHNLISAANNIKWLEMASESQLQHGMVHANSDPSLRGMRWLRLGGIHEICFGKKWTAND